MRDITSFQTFPLMSVEDLQATNKAVVNKNNNLVFLVLGLSLAVALAAAYVHFEGERRVEEDGDWVV
jgi:hypothetical protein